MQLVILVALAVIFGSMPQAQERKVPKDSSRISIPGCAKDRTFIVAEAPEHEPVRSDVEAGRRFRLSGPKKLLNEIKVHQGSMVEVTGLVRTAQLTPGGVSIAGGRIRIGGALPQGSIADPRRDPLYNQVVIDVESWRQLAEPCPTR